MKLFVIVLCLLSERFLEHKSARYRTYWFNDLSNTIAQKLLKIKPLSSPWLLLGSILLAYLLVIGGIFYLTSNGLFGFVGFLLNIVILYFCLGPSNPFYPDMKKDDDSQTIRVETYLVQVNSQLFAVLFWYIFLGPFAALIYRLISLSKEQQTLAQLASQLTSILDWIPARMTSLLYLLVGNFQAGLQHYLQMVFTKPVHNAELLAGCGTQALGVEDGESVGILKAESLVEHALVALLVLIALFTLLKI